MFGQVEDGRPWWGIEGQYFHGPGQRSIEGPSEESCFVLNPFLLVAVDFTGLTPWSPGFEWNRDQIEPEDLNLNYLHVSPKWMVNVFKADLSAEPVRIQHFIHCGGSCRYPGGCNNGSPYQEELDGYRVNALPARLDVLLWHERPNDAGQPADMLFTIQIR